MRVFIRYVDSYTAFERNKNVRRIITDWEDFEIFYLRFSEPVCVPTNISWFSTYDGFFMFAVVIFIVILLI